MKYKSTLYLFYCLFILLNVQLVSAQITAPGSQAALNTEYPVALPQDSIFIFCSSNETEKAASLQAQTALTGTKTFLWEKYNPATASFEFIYSESSADQQSVLQELEDGGYRVTITQGTTSEIHRAWVFNNTITATATIPESNCDFFLLEGSFESKTLTYYDLIQNSPVEVFKDMKAEWIVGENIITSTLNHRISLPPATETEYDLRVYDRFGCQTVATVIYEPMAPRAQFTAEPMEGEAPLTVTFNNQSENADPGGYEWFFYKSLDEIKQESESSQMPIDSIMLVAYDQNPVYTYERSGLYKVKLVAKKTSEFHTCTDTAYLSGYITVDNSLIEVPNVFTPNGDGINDNFVVKFISMESITISIFNRWGKRIHFYENNNVRGFGDTYAATVWDGKVGGRYATPGVYYYVIEGKGRDDQVQKAHGFFHLFRGKD